MHPFPTTLLITGAIILAIILLYAVVQLVAAVIALLTSPWFWPIAIVSVGVYLILRR